MSAKIEVVFQDEGNSVADLGEVAAPAAGGSGPLPLGPADGVLGAPRWKVTPQEPAGILG